MGAAQHEQIILGLKQQAPEMTQPPPPPSATQFFTTLTLDSDLTANASSDDVWEVFEEVVGFGVTFSYLGLPVSLAQPVNASSFKVLTRPANLPIEVVEDDAVGEGGPQHFLVQLEPGGLWGAACGGVLETAIALPAGVLRDTSGRLNGFSNILRIDWWPPSLLVCSAPHHPANLSSASAQSDSPVSFNLLLPGLDIGQFQDTSFEESFSEAYRQQVAAAAGVPLDAVRITGIQASSALIQTQVDFGNSEAATLARQAFQQALVVNASHIFSTSSFSASYGQPQAVLVNNTLPAVLRAPPPPGSPPPQVVLSPPYVNISATPSAATKTVLKAPKAVSAAIPSAILGLAAVAGTLAATLWWVRHKRKMALDAEFVTEGQAPGTPASRTKRFLAQLGISQSWGLIQRQAAYGPSTPPARPRRMDPIPEERS